MLRWFHGVVSFAIPLSGVAAMVAFELGLSSMARGLALSHLLCGPMAIGIRLLGK